jgi:fumarate reductase subunit D
MSPRAHPAWLGFLLHRLSGIALALFLPLHFWALGTAIAGAERLDAFLAWAAHPLVKAAEWGLVMLLALHLAGGLRVMALEFLGWRARQKDLVALSAGVSLAVGLLFLLNAW